jgi:hypothetical protein
MITRAMGGTVHVTAVLLTASGTTAAGRLAGREIGSQLGAHLARSATMAEHLHAAAAHVHRVATDDRTVADIAAQVIKLTGWAIPSNHPHHGPRLEY